MLDTEHEIKHATKLYEWCIVAVTTRDAIIRIFSINARE